MSTPITPASKPRIAPGYRLQWEEAQQMYVLLYPEGMVQLNDSAAAILQFCDGQRSVTQLVIDLEKAFEMEDLSDDVGEFLCEAQSEGWIRHD